MKITNRQIAGSLSPEIVNYEMYYESIFGKTPFKLTKIQDMIKIVNDPILFPSDNTASDNAKDLILKILEKDQKNRLTLDEIRNHKFFGMEILVE